MPDPLQEREKVTSE